MQSSFHLFVYVVSLRMKDVQDLVLVTKKDTCQWSLWEGGYFLITNGVTIGTEIFSCHLNLGQGILIRIPSAGRI